MAASLKTPREQFPTSCSTPDGRWIAGGFVGAPNDSVALWNARTGHLLWEKPLNARLTRVEVDPSSRIVAAEFLTGEPLRYGVALFDIPTAKQRATIVPGSESTNGLDPGFTKDGRLVVHTSNRLEWRDSHAGRLLNAQRVPQSGPGYLLSSQACGRFRIVEYMDTDPNYGISPGKTCQGLEVLSEKDGALCGVLLKDDPRLIRYSADPPHELVALALREGKGVRVKIYHAPTLALLAEKVLPVEFTDDVVQFSRDGSILYVGVFHPLVWNWWTDDVRRAYHHEVRTFTTFYLGRHRVYHQYWDGAIRDAQTDRLVVRLRSRQ